MKQTTSYKAALTALASAMLIVLTAAAWKFSPPPLQQPRHQPSWLDLGTPAQPFTVLLMGDDVTYQHQGRRQIADHRCFQGRSDTMIVTRVDPINGTVCGLQIPRDTIAEIPGYGLQKINAANALGGPLLATATAAQLLGAPVDHYFLLNVHGLVDAVNEIGGVTIDVPRRISYIDWTAKLNIDLTPGLQTLTGNQAMGFVRFRHDQMGDIGRLQRQQIFMYAFAQKLLQPTTWPHLPRLLAIMHDSVLTDLSDVQLIQTFNLLRSLPRERLSIVMLPGRFGGLGSWIADKDATAAAVADLSHGTSAVQARPVR